MERKLIIILTLLFLAGAVAYFALLWNPLGGWLFDNVVTPLATRLGPSRRNPNFLEGMGLMLVSLMIQVLLFLLPYLLLWGIGILLYLRFRR